MAEKCIELDSVEIAAAVFGNCDRNIGKRVFCHRRLPWHTAAHFR